MANGNLERVIGGTPGAVLLRLVVLSIVVGIVLSALGLDPRDIWQSITRLFERIYNMGFDAIEWAFRYFLLGAVIVVPIWILMRVFKVLPGSRNPD
ncbi:MAG: hypothetical protein H6883_03000 [Rhodobiaceae bacterium]|nr:integrase [Rhodobiaceae bacterium]MCC0055086.1 hypothetical protein [Rhodobiaceae bacterium]